MKEKELGVREFFASALKERIKNPHRFYLCGDMRAMKEWARRTLPLAGPVGKLP